MKNLLDRALFFLLTIGIPLTIMLVFFNSCTTISIRCTYQGQYVPCNPHVKERSLKDL